METILFPAESNFSISLTPLLLGEYEAPECKSGCVVVYVGPTSPSNGDDDDDGDANTILIQEELVSKLRQIVPKPARMGLIRAVTRLLCYQTDTVVEIISAVKKVSSTSNKKLAGEDELDWFVNSKSQMIRSYALLRRLAMPMHLCYTTTTKISPGKKKRSKNTTNDFIKRLTTLDISFIDVLLNLDGLKDTVKKCLCGRIKSLRMNIVSKKHPGRNTLLSRKEIKLCKELESSLSTSLTKIGISYDPKVVISVNENDASKDSNLLPLESCTVPEHMQKQVLEVRNERRRILKELDTRKKKMMKQQAGSATNGRGNTDIPVAFYGVGGKIKLKDRIYNGCLLVTEKQMKFDEFCRQIKIMRDVSKTLPRPFNPGLSRPRFHKVDISHEALSRLRSIFFDEETGSLRRSILNDVDLSARHGYINFSNASCKLLRNDYRWQVPIKRHTLSSFVTTRATVESLFSESHLLHPHHEKIHDLGILIGGTEDQSIHHDIPRQTTSWLPEDPQDDIIEPEDHDRRRQVDSMNNGNSSSNGGMGGKPVPLLQGGIPVTGWEFDRAAYNEAMSSPYAPSSILLGMSESGNIHVGVQKNQVERYGCPEGWCRILNGRKEDQFQIIRENDYLVALQANPGGLFTGDFPHAGVRNFPARSEENKLMNEFYDRIESIREDHEGNEEDDHADMIRQLMEMMCNFPNLNKICRFHCSTEPTRGPLRIPRNTVGFVDCRPNPPDV